MRNGWRAAIGAGLAMIAAGARAEPDRWYEARTDHFVVVVQGTAAFATDYAAKLERLDKAMRVLRDAPEQEGDRANPLRVYAVPSISTVQTLCEERSKSAGCGSVAGFFVPHAGRSVAFTPRRAGGGKFDLKAQEVLFHEYAHHFMFGNAAAAYPLWFAEGFAEFNATTDYGADGSVNVGKPPYYRAYSLVQGTQLPLRTLFTTDGSKLSPEQRDSLYARGWLLTHYLTFDAARTGQLANYLTLINRGTASLAAAEQAFGSLVTLSADLDRYRKSRLNYLTMKPDRVSVSAPIVRPLSDGEAAMLPVRWRSDRGVDDATAGDVAADARKRAAPYPRDAAVQASLAEAEYDAGHDDAAEAAADAALAVDPRNRPALLHKGLVRLRRATSGDAPDPAAAKEARSWFVKANRLEPDAAEPLILFYQSFLIARVTPSANAVAGLERAFSLAPQAGEVRYMLGREYVRAGKLDAARAVLAPVAFDPHGRPDNLAARAVTLIDAKDEAGLRRLMEPAAGGDASEAH